MKTILLFRHGKSDWSGEQDDDVRRPLAPRGRKAAKRMGAFVSACGLCPDLVLTSPAVRATETFEIARKAGDWQGGAEEMDVLYGAAPHDVIGACRGVLDVVETLMVIGHEPTLSETLSVLIGGGRFRFPTGAMARIDVDASAWSALQEGDGTLAWLVVPKMLA